jgi:hypothetical protein
MKSNLVYQLSMSKKELIGFFPFVLLCDPLWFNELIFTTKAHKGIHKGSQRTFQTLQ